jgi:hypothetical protein
MICCPGLPLVGYGPVRVCSSEVASGKHEFRSCGRSLAFIWALWQKNTPDTFVPRFSKHGPMWAYRWAAELGVRVNQNPRLILQHGEESK